MGSGQGSRKLYSWNDLYRIALAERLAICGFTPFAIGRAIGEIRASEFNVEIEPSLASPVLVGLGAKWKVMTRGEFRKLEADEQDSGVFVLNFQEVIADVVRAYTNWENREDHENQ